jgi:dolichol-phosphate mannosyltransferase
MSNFLLNNFFTFADRRVKRTSTQVVQFFKFNVISLGGYGLQAASLWVFHTVLGINDIIALAIGIIIATLWNYLLNMWWTWK